MRRASAEDHERLSKLSAAAHGLAMTTAMTIPLGNTALGIEAPEFSSGFYAPADADVTVCGQPMSMMQYNQNTSRPYPRQPGEPEHTPAQWRFYPDTFSPVMANIPNINASSTMNTWRPIPGNDRRDCSAETLYYEHHQQPHGAMARPAPDSTLNIPPSNSKPLDGGPEAPMSNLETDPNSRPGLLLHRHNAESAPVSPHHISPNYAPKFISIQLKGSDVNRKLRVLRGTSYVYFA